MYLPIGWLFFVTCWSCVTCDSVCCFGPQAGQGSGFFLIKITDNESIDCKPWNGVSFIEIGKLKIYAKLNIGTCENNTLSEDDKQTEDDKQKKHYPTIITRQDL